MNEDSHTYTIKEKIQHTEDVFTLKLSLEDGSIPSFIPGQFINIYFPETGITEGKSYSISSSPKEKTLNITIKKIGKFSGKLSELNIGDKISASLPYGYFYIEEDNTDLVLIAGGIGITPFMSMIDNLLLSRPKDKLNAIRHVSLFWSVKKESDLFNKNIFDNYSKENKNFEVNYFVTQNQLSRDNTDISSNHAVLGEIINQRNGLKNLQDKISDNDKNIFSHSAKRGEIINHRINLENLQDQISDTKKEFFVCGSISFVRDYWRMLKEAGVSDENIYTESFF